MSQNEFDFNQWLPTDDFSWEDFLHQPTFEPDLGFEGRRSVEARHPMAIVATELQPLQSRPCLMLQEHPKSQLLLRSILPERLTETIPWQTQDNVEGVAPWQTTPTGPVIPTVSPEHQNGSDVGPASEKPWICGIDGCDKKYRLYEYLSRHIQNAHHQPSRFLCHMRLCPRGIPGRGFPRKDKLVDHLMSKKHDFSREDAIYESALRNPPPYFQIRHDWARKAWKDRCLWDREERVRTAGEV